MVDTLLPVSMHVGYAIRGPETAVNALLPHAAVTAARPARRIVRSTLGADAG